VEEQQHRPGVTYMATSRGRSCCAGAWSWRVEFAGIVARLDLCMLIASFINLKSSDIGGKHRQRLFRYEYEYETGERRVSETRRGRSSPLQLQVTVSTRRDGE